MASFSDFYNIYKSTVNTSDVYDNNGTSMQTVVENREYQIIPRTTVVSVKNNIKPVKGNRMVVVIPLYKDKFTAFEKRNLSNTFRLLKDDYDICILCPRILKDDFIKRSFGFSPQYYREASVYFSGKNSYSRLMERAELYDSFSAWDYMLIV